MRGGGWWCTSTRTSWAEILHPDRDERVIRRRPGELTLTALGRVGFPAIRYRTGDVVQSSAGRCPAGHAGLWLPEGILGRADDMVVIRGMNVFPSAIERVLREMGELGSFASPSTPTRRRWTR